MSSENDLSLQFEARLEAHEHLLRHLIVTVLARTDDPLDAFEGFQRRLTAPLRKKPIQDAAPSEAELSDMQVLEIVDWFAKGVREDIQRALAQVAIRRK